jgi:glutamate:Na+ symporter, ESS family
MPSERSVAWLLFSDGNFTSHYPGLFVASNLFISFNHEQGNPGAHRVQLAVTTLMLRAGIACAMKHLDRTMREFHCPGPHTSLEPTLTLRRSANSRNHKPPPICENPLWAGGIPLLILVVVTIGFMLLQNLTGIAVATSLGLDALVGLLGGSVSLLGGHGTSIAWAPTFAEKHGIPNATEIGIAGATLGLVISSLIGGPIARFLITRHGLEPKVIHQPDVGVTYDAKTEEVGYYNMLSTLFWLNMSLALGSLLQTGLRYIGANPPLFVCSLFAAIILTNTVPQILRTPWPAGTRSLALVSDVSLGVFLAMSLMSLQLWTIVDVAGPILAILTAQTILAVIFALFVIFRFMGRDYEAAVICSGFAGISLGATPTAMANMTAVAKKYGQAHRAFIIVPLVSGFFVDIANAIVISRFLAWFG